MWSTPDQDFFAEVSSVLTAHKKALEIRQGRERISC